MSCVAWYSDVVESEERIPPYPKCTRTFRCWVNNNHVSLAFVVSLLTSIYRSDCLVIAHSLVGVLGG